jgi:hypothetical protein
MLNEEEMSNAVLLLWANKQAGPQGPGMAYSRLIWLRPRFCSNVDENRWPVKFPGFVIINQL